MEHRTMGPLAAALALGLALAGCAAPAGPPRGVKVLFLDRRTPVMLRAVPRHLLTAPREEVVWLWDRPGGPAARALRVARVPSGTEATLLEPEPPRFRMKSLEFLQLAVPRPWPPEWLKVTTARGDGWVRTEFVEPR